VKRAVYAVIVISLLVGCLGVIGCGRGGGSPAEVVKAFYMAANEAKYSEAEGYLSSETKELMKSPLVALGGGLKATVDMATKNGTIERIEITGERIRGEGAMVYFTLYFEDGTQRSKAETLIHEGGRWKITIEPMGGI